MVGRVMLIVTVVAGLLAITVPRPAGAIHPAWFFVNLADDSLLGDGWVEYAPLTIAVDRPTTAAKPDYVAVDAVHWGSWFDVDISSGFNIRPGDVVTITDGVNTKTHVVTFLMATQSDEAADTVTGRAHPGATVTAYLDEANIPITTVANASGHWFVDYAGQRDLKAGTGMAFREFDADGDATQIDVVLPVDPDVDGDGILNGVDNCPTHYNPTQFDGDGDGIGADCDGVERLWGPNRYGTSAAVAEMAFSHASTVFIALGTNFPDALVAAAAGGHEQGPVLLTDGHSLSPETTAELVRLAPTTAYVVGGTAVISPVVEQQVRALVPNVHRLAGANRYETSAAVSSAVFPTATSAFIAYGGNFPDALVGAAAAGFIDAPVLLTGKDHLPQATIDELVRLRPDKIYVIGGTAVISAAAAGELAPYGTVVRLAGSDRYATAAAVAQEFFECQARVFLAYGGDFPDALVAAAAGAYRSAPVLLVTHDTIPAATRGQMNRLSPERIWLVGGTAVIGESVADSALP